MRIIWYKYCPISKLFVLPTGKNTVAVYRLKWESQCVLFKTIALFPKSAGYPLTKAHLYITQLYQDPVLLYIDGQLPCRLHVFSLKSKSLLTLDLSPGSFLLNTFDNLLFMHNVTTKV